MMYRCRFQLGVETSHSSHPRLRYSERLSRVILSSLQIHVNFTLTAPTSTTSITPLSLSRRPVPLDIIVIRLCNDHVTRYPRHLRHPAPRPRRKPRARSTGTRRLSASKTFPLRSRHVCAETDPRVPLSRSHPFSRALAVSLSPPSPVCRRQEKERLLPLPE